jgi:hypothetical protein
MKFVALVSSIFVSTAFAGAYSNREAKPQKTPKIYVCESKRVNKEQVLSNCVKTNSFKNSKNPSNGYAERKQKQ